VRLLAQSGNQGAVAITVQDTTGAMIPGAQLELVENSSNSARKSVTDEKGVHTFVNLNIGTYSLTAKRDGYQTKFYSNVLVVSSATTSLAVTLPVGSITETVSVTTEESALLQTTTTETGTVINTTDIDNLPLAGRSIASLTTLTAGYNGTWNGLPEPAQGTNIDGMVANNGRTKYQGTIGTSVSPRIESFEQVSVVTDGLNLGNGFGSATMQLNYVSRRGSNQFHGRAYYDFRNSGLNANSWANNVSGTRRAKLILHDFGVSGGGPVIKDKLFFFGTFAEYKQPGTANVTNNIFGDGTANNGDFTYFGTGDHQNHTVNLFNLAKAFDPSLTSNFNSGVKALIDKARSSAAGLKTNATADPNLTGINFSELGGNTSYYPVVRLDYNVNDKVRMYLSWLMTQSTSPDSYPQPFPGKDYADQAGSSFTRNFNANYGLDYIITPKLVNSFKVGYMYSKQAFAYGVAQNWTKTNPLFFNMTNDGNNRMSGLNYTLPTGYEYPVFSLTNGVTYQKGAHNLNFGFQGYREQDHYYNAPVGFANTNLGYVTGDPSGNAFTLGVSPTNCTGGTLPGTCSTDTSVRSEALQLYSILAGRISGVSGQYGYDMTQSKYMPHSFNLDEVALSTGIWAQDSWKLRPDLTINYGIRWDFVVDPHDVRAAYHNNKLDSILGPTAKADMFKPGPLAGNLNPVYSLNPRPFHGFYKTPQPQVAVNWNPRPGESSALRKIFGDGATAIRMGFGLRNFTQPYQFYWNNASAFAVLYYSNFGLNPDSSGATGTYMPGSLKYGDSFPDFSTLLNPKTFPNDAPLSQFTMTTGAASIAGIDANIRMPYTESWNFGIQRSFARNTVLEVRYNGNRTVHNWTSLNYNEVNIFENGFLKDFQNAQKNLAASGAAKSFSSTYGNPTPIIDAAFGTTPSNFTNATFIGYLNNGAAGSFANQLAGSSQSKYFCSLVGSGFAPCKNPAGGNFSGPGAGYPINFFQANPYAAGRTTSYMTDAGYSNYNGLQVDLRQSMWHGLQGDFNYTWSKTLGFGTNNNNYTAGADNFYSLRNPHLSYVPQSFDLRHVFHGYGTYDLPFGKNKKFLNNTTLENEIFGGFTVGTVIGYQTGAPFRLTGSYATYNTNDGGVVLNGITPKQLQQSMHITHVQGRTTSLAFDPSLYASSTGGVANVAKLAPNTTAGTIGQIVFLHGPHIFTQNMELTKVMPIHDRMLMNIQASFNNVWNHPTWGTPSGALTSSSFGTSSIVTAARAIELRANLSF
jgi:hypothetical protein